MINNIPPTTTSILAPYAPLGKQPVGQESTDLKHSRFKALEQTAKSARTENRRAPDEHPNEEAELDRVSQNLKKDRKVQHRHHQSSDQDNKNQEGQQQNPRKRQQQLIENLANNQRIGNFLDSQA